MTKPKHSDQETFHLIKNVPVAAHKIQVGDMVECQPEGMMGWVRGTVVNIHLSQALYEVALEPVRIGDLTRALCFMPFVVLLSHLMD